MLFKQALKVTVAFMAIAGSVWFFKNWLWHSDYVDRTKNLTAVGIGLGERIPNLRSADLIICDSIYAYPESSLIDSVHENVLLSGKGVPCRVEVCYNFSDGSSKIF